jgi:hypothetical protein
MELANLEYRIFDEACLIRPGLQTWCLRLHCRFLVVFLLQVLLAALHLRYGGVCRKISTVSASRHFI